MLAGCRDLSESAWPPDESTHMVQISMTVNGKAGKGNVDPRVLLVHFLREHLRLTGTHIG